jgi:hypothetical protein
MIAAVPINPADLPGPLSLIQFWPFVVGLVALALYIRWRRPSK